MISGRYDDVISSFRLIDCRYPYEYEGGHVMVRTVSISTYNKHFKIQKQFKKKKSNYIYSIDFCFLFFILEQMNFYNLFIQICYFRSRRIFISRKIFPVFWTAWHVMEDVTFLFSIVNFHQSVGLKCKQIKITKTRKFVLFFATSLIMTILSFL